jgi:hypothetical protein
MAWLAPAQQLAAKTHCVRGHEYTPENIYRKDDGYRRCRACKRIDDNARQQKKAAA